MAIIRLVLLKPFSVESLVSLPDSKLCLIDRYFPVAGFSSREKRGIVSIQFCKRANATA
jgi:hypothetical protein